jgi:hypothetical protein
MGRGIGTRAVAGGHQGEIVDRDQALGFLLISRQQPLGPGFGSAVRLVTA